MDQCESEIKLVSHGGGSLGATGVGRDNDTFLFVTVDFDAIFRLMQQVFSDPFETVGLGVEIVDGNVEEPLNLAGMEVHCDDVVTSCRLQHICHELRRDGRPRFVFLVLSSIWEVRENSRDSSGGGGLAGIDYDKQLHEHVVDVIGFRGL